MLVSNDAKKSEFLDVIVCRTVRAVARSLRSFGSMNY